MARLRYSRDEADAEATRRTMEFIAERSDYKEWRHQGTYPDSIVPASRSSKHPVAWVAVFAPIPRESEVMDGGELYVVVDLEAGSVAVKGF